jgi:Protein of unknown function (DUF1769)
MVRPTPQTMTKIRGIRFVSDYEYRDFAGFCAGCILPVNTGREAKGQSLVVDFETNHFVGTLLLRIKNVVPVNDSSSDASTTPTNVCSYFDHRKRRFQAIVKGKFKTALPMSDCVTGQTFDRRAGKLPAPWVVHTFIKFVSALAPQLETTLEGDNPRFLVPLVATAQTVMTKPHTTTTTTDAVITQHQGASLLQGKLDTNLLNCSVYLGSQDLDDDLQEPPATDPTSILQELGGGVGTHNNLWTTSSSSSKTTTTISSRMHVRKKVFNAISAKKSKTPCFSLDKEYTFEFYQHLLVFDEPEFTLDMGRPIGKVALSTITDGQPIKFMSAYKDPITGKLDSLWSFDIWHESMYALAQKADAATKRPMQ